MRFFFYGTLLDGTIRSAVCGRQAGRWRLRPARLAGYRRGRRPGSPYPVLVPDEVAVAEGAVVEGVGAAERLALIDYEGDGYRLVERVVDTPDGPLTAWVFLPASLPRAPLPWSLAAWRGLHRRRTLAGIRRARHAAGQGP